MKILILVMSHITDDQVFKTYKEIWDKKVEIIKNNGYPVDILFLYSDNTIEDNYIVKGNNLYTNCIENYWNSLLLKSISGFQYSVNKKYDLVFKTNLSTMININRFVDYCLNINNDIKYVYDGSVGSYKDYQFCSGAGLLLNNNSIGLLLDNIDKITSEWTDDIFIGYVLNKLNGITPNQGNMNRFNIVEDNYRNLTINDIEGYTHIRIKIRSNESDIFYTNLIFNLLYD
jgi:CRISPR/Cas system CMR-associated protein Cmr5 small subunit